MKPYASKRFQEHFFFRWENQKNYRSRALLNIH